MHISPYPSVSLPALSVSLIEMFKAEYAWKHGRIIDVFGNNTLLICKLINIMWPINVWIVRTSFIVTVAHPLRRRRTTGSNRFRRMLTSKERIQINVKLSIKFLDFQYLGTPSINILDQHLDRYSINIPRDTRLTLHQHLINSWLIVCQVSTDSFALIKN